jgi:hypothetical protein
MAWGVFTHRRSSAQGSCRHLCGCKWRDWRGCWSRCQPAVRRAGHSIVQPLCRGFCGVNLSLGFQSHAFLDPMRIVQEASLSLHHDTAATSTKRRIVVIRGRSMKFTVKSWPNLDCCPCWSFCQLAQVPRRQISGRRSGEADGQGHQGSGACAEDIQKYCSTVTPGEGRMIYCMQAHGTRLASGAHSSWEAATSVQTAADALKDAVIACKAEIIGRAERQFRARVRSLLVCCRTNRQLQPVR